MARFLYNLALLFLLPYVGLHLLLRSRRQPEYLRHVGERFGRYPSPQPSPRRGEGADLLPSPASGRGAGGEGLIWLHAVSVGETRAAAPIVAALKARHPGHRILLTHMTPTGRRASEDLFGDGVERAYLPYDYPCAVRRFLAHFRPAIGVVMETEIWPNLVAICKEKGLPLLLANARLSEKSARRYARFPNLTRGALQGLAALAAQTEQDAARLRALGAPQVEVLGNVKFDCLPAEDQLALGEVLRERIGSRPVLLAASTREGEEALLFEALAQHPLGEALLVVVPRHPQRFEEVAALAAKAGFAVQRRSENAPVAAQTQVLLGDSMGELFAYYAACDVAFVGGSLLDYGSQNLIEACAVGRPVLIGRSIYNFTHAAEQALECGAARQIGSAEELLEAAGELLADEAARQRMGEAGKAFAARHRGATAQTVELIESRLAGRPTA
ncbi:MAG: 3-deoxy-D-manno-octulosonic acid transferase [Rhodocyclaceae bacterium]|uniref:3-deoxy-D-manno-octulosonic acid transferase n=1 Tax=Candidatus Desulfobacillus denitrificans TaxID=2608985 RepID=A0A809QVR4_9PROT|nr:3-deoxy-D-manno-octulosonic-acid transferase [Candidatus Desulfobacillus denitrificans]GIK46738.1 MAG: 3-deoxy-D-manno-octulosonic acid transferase [Betaproteobacteria bacterium]GJQ56080.1 MAG: 3-deoxy-D-manno-octulosonic acid transferase [Rhodocyclaceae bacterium]